MLVLWADGDSALGANLLTGIHEEVPKVEVHVLENCSHWIQQDKCAPRVQSPVPRVLCPESRAQSPVPGVPCQSPVFAKLTITSRNEYKHSEEEYADSV